MRSLEYAHPLSAVPPHDDGGLAGAVDAPHARCYFLNSLSNASRASLALRGGGVFVPGIRLPGPCADEASRATVTRGENRAQSFC
jgi:hypothetical protein